MNNSNPQNAAASLEDLLGADAPPPWWKRKTPWLLAVLLLAALAAALLWRGGSKDAAAQPQFQTEAVQRGTLSVKVVANGTLAPTLTVNVGSELSGTVARVFVDINDRVTKGQVLVELDTSKLRDQMARSRAALASAEARVAQAAATLKEARANLARMEEVQRLSGGRVPSATEFDTARANAERAAADEAAARASVADAKAALRVDETNLGKASIRAPIDGVVLTRSVDPGNAVAASLQAVTLFTIAADLTQMKLQVNVDEADVGQLREGQRARFTVAAQPGRQYPAVVTRVAFGSTTTDNVVTYTTQLDVQNADLTLRPGMTATASIAATERAGVLLVPNSALRFTPSNGSAAAGGLVSKLMPRPPGMGGRRGAAPAGGNEGTVWVLKDGAPVALKVTKGLSDGRQTEVSGDGVAEGLAVVTEQLSAVAK